jgi:glutamate synthase domain-containing protein 2/glutamate synthase domain-containing protein 1/glutamate synthase domain-containing protein 3
MAIGLYDASYEHDACGVGMVADLHGRPDHGIVDKGLTVLERLAHRGASGAEASTGDGAGILVQVPHRFLVDAAEAAGFSLPDAGTYAVGVAFLPGDDDDAAKAKKVIEALAVEEKLSVLGWRVVPVATDGLGETALGAMPAMEQLFVVPAADSAIGNDTATADPLDLERRAFVLRKRAEHAVDGLYFSSLSARTIVYKGMLTSEQLRTFFTDLEDPRFESGLALVHSRFSTNTFPSWPLAHPYRYMAHNGEINTLAGNRNWMRAREALLSTPLIGGDLDRIYPVCTPGASDSASFDEVLELLHLAGRSLPHAVLMMIPEAWENHSTMDHARRAFYRYHASLMEPWDGPAAVCFTDGTVVGAVLDRNGLRPARYWVTDDDLVVLASEVGVLDIAPGRIVRKGRLQPGRMFLVDTAKGRLVDDDEIKTELAAAYPYDRWLAADQVRLEELPARAMLTPQHGRVVSQQRLFGYTNEELRVILGPMARTGLEPLGSMGSDAAIAVLSDRSRLLYDYFTQLFAQVTNPPLDAIREELVTSLAATVGPEGNLLDAGPGSCRQILLPLPVIDRDDLAKLMYVNEHGETPGFKAFAIDGLFEVGRAGRAGEPTAAGGEALARALADVRRRVSEAIATGANIIVLSDRNSTEEWAPIPSLLLTSAVHHHLVREKTRTQVGLVIETGDAREVHHMALLIGFGAAAVNPYLALDTIDDMIAEGLLEGVSPRQARRNYMKAACKGVLKVMSKMGISTVASYTGAQVFEAIGLDRALIDEYFTGTASRIGGIGLSVLAAEVAARHAVAYESRPTERAHRELEVGGEYQWRREGEYHLFNPKTVFKLQHATRSKQYAIFKEYTAAVDDQAEKLATLRGLLRLRTGPASLSSSQSVVEVDAKPLVEGEGLEGGEGYADVANRTNAGIAPTPAPTESAASGGPGTSFSTRTTSGTHQKTSTGARTPLPGGHGPIPIEEVEPIAAIMKRFSTGAMSYGSISAEAHENLAIAMNRIGGRSNTGEGGEDAERYTPDANGDLRRSSIKQVASGRFGVTGEYLVNADDIQIKISQGAKPGEGGQLAGKKIWPWIARTRNSTPGVELISPPPHHDIYSIEDIAQLIHDLKSANPAARVHVKLVAEVGVGTVAAGVAKAHSDVVLISGHDGGTGAAPLTSLKHAGIPWEIGLAETQQTLLANGLRDRIVVQVDGQLKTGRDVVIGALLGAEEFGFASAPLVVSGCIMMRVCHLDTCPVGIATQTPALRAKFNGKPEFVETFFEYIAEEVRELLASLGLRTLEEAVGRVDLLDADMAIAHWKAAGLDLSSVLAVPDVPDDMARHQTRLQDHGLEKALDHQFMDACAASLSDGTPVSVTLPISNVDRTVGTLLGSEISRRFGAAGLRDDTISLTFTGSAGQSFGAFVPRGVTMRLYGDANDYFGKGLSGGRLIVRPQREAVFAAEEQIIAGNVILYGATGGEVFIRGQVGERFCVRNSGAVAVVEGVGDHGCEYMTGGRVVVLGPTGRNFAAGMSGGIAYIYDPERTFGQRVNLDMVDVETLDGEDSFIVRNLIERHAVETDSAMAARLLEHWDLERREFVKVVPRDYRRIMEAARLAEAEGRPVDEAIMEAAARG